MHWYRYFPATDDEFEAFLQVLETHPNGLWMLIEMARLADTVNPW